MTKDDVGIPLLIFCDYQQGKNISQLEIISQGSIHMAVFGEDGPGNPMGLDNMGFASLYWSHHDEKRTDFQKRVLDKHFMEYPYSIIIPNPEQVEMVWDSFLQVRAGLALLSRDERFGTISTLPRGGFTDNPDGKGFLSSSFPYLKSFGTWARVWESFRETNSSLIKLKNSNEPTSILPSLLPHETLFGVDPHNNQLLIEFAAHQVLSNRISLLPEGKNDHQAFSLPSILLPDLQRDHLLFNVPFPDDRLQQIQTELKLNNLADNNEKGSTNHLIFLKMLRRIYHAIKRRISPTAQTPEPFDPKFGMQVGTGTMIGPCKQVEGAGYIVIGDHCHIGANGWFGAFDSYPHSNQKFTPSISIGNNVFIGDNAIITSVNKVIIEDGVEISHDVFISDHVHSNTPEEGIPLTRRRLVSRGYVKIGAYTGIGLRSVISQGVTLGKYCFVTPNSVVTRSFPDYSMIRGNPAILIKIFSKEKNKWIDPDDAMIKKYNAG